MNDISRRNMLKQLALGGLISAVPAAFLAGPGRDVFQPLASRLSQLFSNVRSAQIVGQRYLALVPAEADPAVLAARIAGSVQQYLRLAGSELRTLRELLTAQQREDFAAGRTVNIDGWILSCTEARLCAIAALEPELFR